MRTEVKTSVLVLEVELKLSNIGFQTSTNWLSTHLIG
jgi:hypothetical protein